METHPETTASMTQFELGVVIGKFYPPHRGHKFLIDTACSQCDRVIVIVCERPTDTIPGSLCTAWLQEIHPAAEVILIDDRYDENDSRVWAENTVRWIGCAPEAVFTSACYGDRYAELMLAKHICVDQARAAVPVSGTVIRADPFANWNFLEPPVRAWFAKHICIVGAESTGTITLSQALATELNTRGSLNSVVNIPKPKSRTKIQHGAPKNSP
jgi:HTH-type transcriptional regulator, transcriptional repressor of NAD biosynthesis genes